jgi:hypothetical protein
MSGMYYVGYVLGYVLMLAVFRRNENYFCR